VVRTSILDTKPEHCIQIAIKQPILSDSDIAKLRYIKHPEFKEITIQALFPAQWQIRRFGTGNR
jgi:hypothetical protein